MFKENCNTVRKIVLVGSLLTFGITTNVTAQNAGKSKFPYQKNPFREGEILGPDSSTEPLPVELVEDPALGSSPTIKKQKPASKAQPQNELSDKELLRDLSAKIADGDEASATSDEEATTTLNAKDVEIATLVKSFSRIAKRNYVVDSNVKGKVTIHLAEGISTGEALRILDSVLLLKGFTSVPIGPNTYKIIQAKDAKKTTIPTVEQGSEGAQEGAVDKESDALVTQLIRLKNVQAQDMQSTLQQFVSSDGMITTFQGTNSLIVIDSAANIERIAKVVKQLDVPALDQDVTVIPVKYAQAKDIAEKISQILGQDDKSASSTTSKSNLRLPPPTNVQNAAMAGIPPAPSTPTGLIDSPNSGRRALPAKVLADERTNAIIVVADQDTTKKVQALVEQLDSKVDLSGGKFYVVRLKHADAEDLSDVLNAVLGGGGGSGGSRRSSGTSGSSLNRRQSNSGMSGFGNNSFGNSGFGSSRGRFGGGSSGGGNGGQGNSGGGGGFTVGAGKEGSKVNFEGEVSIASDPTTNSIIVSSSKNDFLKVKEVIDILDIRRKQVLVESTILEVTLDKNKELGFDLVGSLACILSSYVCSNTESQ